MKKMIVLNMVMWSSLLYATSEYELSIEGGVIFPDSDTKMQNQTIFGGALQYNGFDSFLSPELQILQSFKTDFKEAVGSPPQDASTSVNRIMLNAVHDFDFNPSFVPYVKLGIGYESFHSEHYFKNDDSMIADAGVGMKFPLNDWISLKVEGLYMHKLSGRKDNNFGLLGGISFAFGEKIGSAEAEETPPVEEKTPAVVNTPAKEKEIAVTVTTTAVVPSDSDDDGIYDDKDLCPDTPAGLQVNKSGCAIAPKVNFSFALNSTIVPNTAIEQIQAYANFLLKTGKSVRIVGHTDNSGTETYNKPLSLKRAQNAADILIQDAVPAEKIEIAGHGETEPLMSNKTAEGRTANRRVEFLLP